MAVPQSLKDARTALATSQATTRSKVFARDTARQSLSDAIRQFAVGSTQATQAQTALDGTQTALNTARTNEATARTTLNAAIKTWLSDASGNPLTPDADYARMTLASAPVAMFPLRLETRFDVAAATLHVRVYPDEFFSDIHERELTPDEVTAGDAYWQGLTPATELSEPTIVTRWATISQRYGVPRAAYIVRARTPPTPPQPALRATTPSRAAEAVLPDRWVVLAFKNGDLRQVRAGLPIPEPLNLTPDPSNDAETQVEVADTFTVPSSILWTVRYDEALAKGMAIDIDHLAPDEVTGGFDRVVVVGVKTSVEPQDASNMIADLFDSHHFTRGLDLVAQGTPTNNVPGRPTPFTMTEPTAAESFQIERVGPESEPPFAADYVTLSDMFRFNSFGGPFTFLAGSVNDQHDIADGADMRRVIWPATLGYFMRQMMNPSPYLDVGGTPIFSEATIQRAKDFFLTYVSAQGPAPALRVGAVPYGLLPAISISRMSAQTGEDGGAIDVMRKLVGYWRAAVATNVPTVPRTSTDRNTDLMKVLSQKSHSDGVFVRNSIGVQTMMNFFQFIVQDMSAFLTALAQLANPVLGALGHLDWAAARIFDLTFLFPLGRYAGPLVTANPQNGLLVSAVADPNKPPTDPKNFNYLRYLADGGLPLSVVSSQGQMPNAAPPTELIPLLYLLARHSLLLEAIEAGRSAPSGSPLATAFATLKQIDVELWGITTVANEGGINVFNFLGSRPGNTAHTVFEQIQKNFDDQNHLIDSSSRFTSLSFSLGSLSVQPVATLERLLTETLDLAAHRLDSFITALATRRLSKYRTAQGNAPPTTYLGAYGFVEDVRPTPRTTRQITGIGTVDVQADNGGFIHAPSLRHATAAAILRSGRMAEKKDPTKYAIELPSERARRARNLIDGVRNGQPLGGLLGFELESGLRARGMAPQNISGIEAIILTLRTLYPQVANKSQTDPGQPSDRIAARNVVDGQRVRQAAASNAIPFGSGGLPTKTSSGGQALLAEVSRLDEIMDGIGDLSVSEAIYQIAAGDVVTAEAAMNFLPEGNNPPEPQVTDSPATGIAVGHRVALLIEGTTLPGSLWTPGASPRAAADPFLEAWVGSLLGDPTEAAATVTFSSPPGAFVKVSLSDLDIGAVDFLALAQSTAAAGQGSPLDRRIIQAALLVHAGAPQITIGYDTPAAPKRSIPQLIELARALGTVLGSARELTAADLRLAADGVDDTLLQPVANDLTTRANTAVGALTSAFNALDNPSDARAALSTASAYLADAYPDANATSDALTVAVTAARAELGRRLTDAQAALPAPNIKNALAIASAISALRTVFGRNSLAVMPAAVPQGGKELGQSLAALDEPLNLGDNASIDAHQAPGRFLQQASRVHEQLQRWRRFSLYAGAFGAPPPRLSVAQLPFVAGEHWAGRSAPTASRTSFLFISANGQTARPDPTAVWRGLLLDQWAELVPGNKAETALAFHYDSQNAEAPQVILMAMQSGQAGGWTLAELHSIVNETMDLAQTRALDSDPIAIGQLVPPICLASNSENQVVSTNIGPNARQAFPDVG